MIPTYNCADLLAQTLQCVLRQDLGSDAMQIEVVDDCSTTDDPHAVVRRIAGERVAFFRQPTNLGHVGNFNTCLQRARGRFVHILHGDDLVRDGFYAALLHGLMGDPAIGAAFCRTIFLNGLEQEAGMSPLEREDSGVLDGWIQKIAARQRVGTPSVIVRRDVYETLGGFDRRFRTAGEDWEMWVRIAAHHPVWYEPRPLAAYRITRPGSLTQVSSGTAKLVREMELACEVISEYLDQTLPTADANRCLSQARRFYAGWALNTAEQLVGERRKLAALPHLLAAYRCFPVRWTRKACIDILRGRPVV